MVESSLPVMWFLSHSVVSHFPLLRWGRGVCGTDLQVVKWGRGIRAHQPLMQNSTHS